VLDHPPIRLANHCSVRITRYLDTATIWLTGEFDLACEERFRAELGIALDSPVETLVMDLRGLEFIDSTGLRMLLQIDAAAKDDGFDLVILCRNGQVRRVLAESGLDGMLPVVEQSGAVPASDSPI
jgi:anti-sigma B factor antagonist